MHTFTKFLRAIVHQTYLMKKNKNNLHCRPLFFSESIQRTVAYFLIVLFLFSDLGLADPHLEKPLPSQEIMFRNPEEILASLSLPEDLGAVSESFIPKNASKTAPFVIYLQNAHANFESENHIRESIQHFQRQLGLELVLLEGGEGELDSLLFKSFPDQEMKERLLKDYLQKGELSGGEAASITGQNDKTAYYGIEQQAVYNENKKAFLSALEKQPEILKELERASSKLRADSNIFHPEPRLFVRRQTQFYAESIDLLRYAKTLRNLFYHCDRKQGRRTTAFASHFPELDKLLKITIGEDRTPSPLSSPPGRGRGQSATKHSRSAAKFGGGEGELSRFIRRIQHQWLPQLSRVQQIQIGTLIQQVRTGQTTAGFLIKRIEELGPDLKFQIPEALRPTAQQARTLSSIQGTKLFQELESLEDDLRNALPRSKEEAALLRDFYQLRLLKRLAKFELTRGEWARLKSTVDSPQSAVVSPHPSPLPFRGEGRVRGDLWTAHYDFYELALKRDQILFENTDRMIKKRKAKIAAIVTGGFHTQGITRKLQDANIPYAVISPKITEVGPDTNYIRAMTGKNSFMRYFKNNLWDAFAEDYGHKAVAGLNDSDRPLVLKRWRDQIIQNAIRAEKITEAGSYTKYVDAFIKPGLQDKSSSSFEQARQLTEKRLRIFGAGLKEMWTRGNINPQALEQVFQRMNTVSHSHLGQDLALIPGTRSLVFEMPAVGLRSEVRGKARNSEEKNGSQGSPYASEVVGQKREEARKILKNEHSDKQLRDFFDRVWGSFTLNHLEAKSVTAARLSDQIQRIYRLFQSHIADPSHPIRVDIFNPVFSSTLGEVMQAGHTEVLIVAQEREGLDSDITTIFRDAKINIEQSFTSKITFPRTSQKIIVYIYEVKHHGNILNESEMAEILERLKNIPSKADTNGHGETVLKGIPHSQDVILGEIAVLRELSGGIEDVAYDIFGELRGGISDLENASAIDGIIRRDRAEFNAAIDWIINEEKYFSGAYPEGQSGFTDQAIAFLNDLKAQTSRKTYAPVNYDHPHRQSALNILLDIIKEKIESARKLNATIDGLSIEVVETIQQRIVNQLHSKYRLYDEDAPEEAQRKAVEMEIKKFEKALKQALETKTSDPKALARLRGIQFFIEGESGIKDAVIEKISTGGVLAQFAIADVVIPMVKNLSAEAEAKLKSSGGASPSDETAEKMQSNANDIRKIFTNTIRFSNGGEDQIYGKPLVGVQTGNNLVLFARHADPFEILRVLKEYPSIKAIVSDEGSNTSHWGLVAEDRGILAFILDARSNPAMNILDPSLVGTTVIVDAKGKVIVNPSEASQEEYSQRFEDQNTFRQIALQHAGEEAVTEDGQIIHVMANADNAERIHDAMDNGAEGIGLVRTEYLFTEDNEFLKAYLKNPTPENRAALVNYFKEMFTDMALHTRKGDLTIRMFDLERDKKSFLDQPEYNPDKAYGLEYYWTGIGKDLLEIEIEAALKANLASTRGQIRILFPMNQAPEDLARKLNNRENLFNLKREEQQLLNEIVVLNVHFLNETLDKMIQSVQEELRETLPEGKEKEAVAEIEEAGIENRVKKIQRGFMVETYEGLSMMPHILERADFISVGTNDLTISLFRDLKRIDFSRLFSFFKNHLPGFYAHLDQLAYRVVLPMWDMMTKSIPVFGYVKITLYDLLPSREGISRDRTEDAYYLNELQPRVLEAVRHIAEQVAKKNASLEREGLAKRVPVCVCGALAGSNAFALYMTHAPPKGVSLELSTSGLRIPLLKQFIRGINSSHTAFLKRMRRPNFNLPAEASKQAAFLMEQQKRKLLHEYEEKKRLRQIQDADIPPPLKDESSEEDEENRNGSTVDNKTPESVEKTPPALPVNINSRTKYYTVGGTSTGLHMLPLQMINQVIRKYQQLEAVLTILDSEGKVATTEKGTPKRENIKMLMELISLQTPRGSSVSIELTGTNSDMEAASEALENLEEEDEKLLLPAAPQEASPSRSELRSDAPNDETKFRPLIEEILDREKISKISNYLNSARAKNNATGLYREVSELLDLIPQNGGPDPSNRSELRSGPVTQDELVELIRARKLKEAEAMFDQPLTEGELGQLLKVWDQMVLDGKIPRAFLNPAEELIQRKRLHIQAKFPENSEIQEAYERLGQDLRQIGVQITGRIRKELEEFTESATATLPIQEVVLPEVVDPKVPEWLMGNLMTFLNKKMQDLDFKSTEPAQHAEIEQHITPYLKSGRYSNFITINLTGFAEEILKKYGILLDPRQNPKAAEVIHKRLVPVAVFQSHDQRIRASFISHQEHFNKVKGSILEKTSLLFSFRLHDLPNGNYRLKFETIKDPPSLNGDYQIQAKIEKWFAQKEDRKILKDLPANWMEKVLARLREEDKKAGFRLEVHLPFRKDEDREDWFLLPDGFWIARDRKDVMKKIGSAFRSKGASRGFGAGIKVQVVYHGEDEGYLSLNYPKRDSAGMLRFLKNEIKKSARAGSKNLDLATWAFSLQWLPEKKLYMIRRYPLEPLPPFQNSRSELRGGKKRGKTGRIEDIKIDPELIVSWSELEEAMQKMPKAAKRMPLNEKRIRREYEKLLFRGLHAGNLTFSQRTQVRNFLVEQNLGLVGDWVNKLGFTGEDVQQNGTIGLTVAVGDYNPAIGQLSTYATWWIKNYIYQTPLSEKMAREPRDYQDIRKRYHAAEERLRQRLGWEPTIEEIAEAIAISPERLISALSWGMRTVYSLDTVYEDNDESSPFGDLLGRMSKGSEEDRELVFKLLSVLTRRQQVIIKMRFGIGTFPHNFREIARIFSVKHQRIQQVEVTAVARMRRAKEVLNTDDFSEFVRVMPSEDHADIYLVNVLGVFPSDRQDQINPEFEKMVKKGRLALEKMDKTNGRHYVFEIQHDKKLEKVSIPQIARYPKVLALGHDLIEHRLRLLLKGKEVPKNGTAIHIALDLKEIRKNPRLLLTLPEETLRLRTAKHTRRSEVRSTPIGVNTLQSLKLLLLNYFFEPKIQRLYDFAEASLDEERAHRLVTDILQRTPVLSGRELFDWKPVWLDTFEQEALKEDNLSERAKLLFLAQGFELMGKNGTQNPDYARISASLKGIYRKAKEADFGEALSAVQEVRIDFEEEDEKIPGYLFIPKTDAAAKKIPVVVIYHGLTSRKEHPYFDGLIKKLIEKDVAVLLTDLPAHGEYTRTFEGLEHFKRYTQAILRYLREQKDFPEIEGQEVSFFGFSFGGHIGLRLLLDREMEKEFQAMVVMNPPFRDSFLHVPTLREHKAYLEAAFGQTEFSKLTAVVKDFALSEDSFAEFVGRPTNLKLILGEKDTVIVQSDIQRARRAFPSENVLFYENQGHYLADEAKEDAYNQAADFFVQAFQRSELRKIREEEKETLRSELRPIAEIIRGESSASSFDQIIKAAEILRTEQKRGVSVEELIRDLRILIKVSQPSPHWGEGSPPQSVADPSRSLAEVRGSESLDAETILTLLKSIRQNALIEIHIPQALERAPEDIRSPLMDGFLRFADNLARFNPNLKFRLVFSSKEAKDHVRRFYRVTDKNIKVISEKTREFTRLTKAEPAGLIISGDFSDSLLGQLNEEGSLGFNAGSFADQSSIDWTGSGQVTLEQITLAALTTLTPERLKGIISEPAHPNIFRAEGKAVLQGLELAAHRLAVEAAQLSLIRHSA